MGCLKEKQETAQGKRGVFQSVGMVPYELNRGQGQVIIVPLKRYYDKIPGL